MNKMLEEALRLLDCTPWYLFQLQASGYPRELCGTNCEQHRDDGSGAMEDCECLFCHSSYSATRDPDRLREMWGTYPHGLLALRTGLKSQVFVVDCDRHPGGADGVATLAELKRRDEDSFPDTVTSLTGGGGKHLFYLHPGEKYLVKSSQSRLGPGIDVKGENSYVVLPPSHKASKSSGYNWEERAAPWEETIWKIDARTSVAVASEPDHIVRIIDIFDEEFLKAAPLAVEEARDRLMYAVRGERNSLLFLLGCRIGEAMAAGVMTKAEGEALAFPAGLKHFTRHETEKTLRSGIRTGNADALRGRTRDIR